MTSTNSFSVRLGERAYSIHIGRQLLADAQLIANNLPTPNAALITNVDLWAKYGKRLAEKLQACGVRTCMLALPDGESTKSYSGLENIHEMLLRNNCDRHTTLLALGGGVIGDLAGFAAATYQRGVPYIQIPTSLLAMVDSSVGGKTAINHALGKNMIGAFHQPACVIADISTLDTLPSREYQSALAEVVKYGLVSDVDFFQWIENSAELILQRDSEMLANMIIRSCQIKARFVEQDERETDPGGIRALLNLGHTFGHAIESALGYGTWLHGEAVACGTVLAAEFAHTRGMMQDQDVARVRSLLAKLGLPIAPPQVSAQTMLMFMQRDKKNARGMIRLVLPKGLGASILDSATPSELLNFLTRKFPAK